MPPKSSRKRQLPDNAEASSTSDAKRRKSQPLRAWKRCCCGCSAAGHVVKVTPSRQAWLDIVESPDAVAGADVYVGIAHFPQGHLYGSGAGGARSVKVKGNAVPTPKPHLALQKQLDAGTIAGVLPDYTAPPRSKTSRSPASLKRSARTSVCPCAEGAGCSRDLSSPKSDGGEPRAVRPPAEAGPSWCSHICGGSDSLASAAWANRTPVDVKHMRPFAFTATDGRHPVATGLPEIRHRPIGTKLAQQVPAEPLQKQLAAEQARERQAQQAQAAQDQLDQEQLAEEQQQQQPNDNANDGNNSDSDLDDGLSHASAQTDEPFKSGMFSVVEEMKRHPSMTKHCTDHNCFEELVLLFEHIDADGAFSSLRLINTSTATGTFPPEATGRNKRSHRRPLTPFEEMLFFLVAFSRFSRKGRLKHAGHLFGLKCQTALRLCETWTVAMGTFFAGQQHPATRQQARASVPAHSQGALGQKVKGKAGYMGDCTERWVDDPTDGSQHAALHSSYKGPSRSPPAVHCHFPAHGPSAPCWLLFQHARPADRAVLPLTHAPQATQP